MTMEQIPPPYYQVRSNYLYQRILGNVDRIHLSNNIDIHLEL